MQCKWCEMLGFLAYFESGPTGFSDALEVGEREKKGLQTDFPPNWKGAVVLTGIQKAGSGVVLAEGNRNSVSEMQRWRDAVKK